MLKKIILIFLILMFSSTTAWGWGEWFTGYWDRDANTGELTPKNSGDSIGGVSSITAEGSTTKPPLINFGANSIGIPEVSVLTRGLYHFNETPLNRIPNQGDFCQTALGCYAYATPFDGGGPLPNGTVYSSTDMYHKDFWHLLTSANTVTTSKVYSVDGDDYITFESQGLSAGSALYNFAYYYFQNTALGLDIDEDGDGVTLFFKVRYAAEGGYTSTSACGLVSDDQTQKISVGLFREENAYDNRLKVITFDGSTHIKGFNDIIVGDEVTTILLDIYDKDGNGDVTEFDLYVNDPTRLAAPIATEDTEGINSDKLTFGKLSDMTHAYPMCYANGGRWTATNQVDILDDFYIGYGGVACFGKP